MFRNIEFKSQGAILRGRLYLLENKSKKSPVVIMAHGFTTTINGMTADKYAERFREEGFAVILYDHRNFGISDGEPRQEINFWIQSRGYIDCIDFVTTQPEIDTSKVAVWGASLSAREAFLVGSVDERVKAIINQIPAYGDDFPTEDKDSKLYSFAKETVLTDKILDLPHTITRQMPIVSSDQIGTPSALSEITAYRWFIEYGGRYGTNWKNIVSFSNTEIPSKFHIGQCSEHLKAPILMVVANNDEMEGSSNEVTNRIFKMIKKPKELIEVDGGHFGLLHYPSSIFDKSSQVQVDFLNKYFK
ncbi:alpha/beta hydrolase [Psychroserpens ponticola]|uniref:Alpha/beta hydrolase n=1 Tax=Psychroserpens ponticola TaxID=2932268 RepID=A0ABY7RTL1_9FLAO|nr:alpha/beta fold hydrolase [Psychroserpens ponticola]WCO00274.1 alpha/beta hydrolase [Psychroserpens ponticola]